MQQPDNPADAVIYEPPKPTEEYITDARRRILAYGWMIQGVADVNDSSGLNDQLYTVGLTDAGLPELVLCGIPRNTMAQNAATAVLNHLARQSLAQELVAGRRYPSGLDDDTPVEVVAKEPVQVLGLALALYGRERVRCLVVEPVTGGPE